MQPKARRVLLCVYRPKYSKYYHTGILFRIFYDSLYTDLYEDYYDQYQRQYIKDTCLTINFNNLPVKTTKCFDCMSEMFP